MTTRRIDFPEFEEPTTLTEEGYQAVASSYRRWVTEKIEKEAGKNGYHSFLSIVREIEGLRQAPFEIRCLHMVAPNSPRTRLVRDIRALQLKMGDNFIPVCELGADILFLIAEAGEVALRQGHKSASSTKEEQAVLQHLAGVGTLDEVTECYESAANIYYGCATTLVQIAKDSARDDLRRTQLVAVDQIVAKHLSTKSRALLSALAQKIENEYPEVKIDIATLGVVMTHVIKHPETRLGVITPQKLKRTFWMLECFLNQTFNSNNSVTILFNNLAGLAIIVGDNTTARRAYQIAIGHAGQRRPQALLEIGKLLELLDPRFRA